VLGLSLQPTIAMVRIIAAMKTSQCFVYLCKFTVCRKFCVCCSKIYNVVPTKAVTHSFHSLHTEIINLCNPRNLWVSHGLVAKCPSKPEFSQLEIKLKPFLLNIME